MISILRHKEFTKLLIGRLVSNMGDSFYAIGAMILVQSMTGSVFYTGLAGFITTAPKTFQFLVGPVVDRLNLKYILVYTQLIQGAILLLIVGCIIFDLRNIWIYLPMFLIVSVLEQFFYPAQNVILSRIFKQRDLINANTLFTFTYQTTDTVFKGLGGLLITLYGYLLVFSFDAISFMITGILFLTLRSAVLNLEEEENLRDKKKNYVFKQYLKDLKLGIVYVSKSVLIWLFVIAILSNLMLGMSFAVLPELSLRFGGADVYGYAMASMGVGLLIGALMFPYLSKIPVGILSVVLFFFGALSWLSILMFQSRVLFVLLFGLAWLPIGTTNIMLFTFIQSNVRKSMVGRVVSLLTSTSLSLMPIGTFLGGVLGEIIDPLNVFLISGLSLLFISLYCLLMPVIRNMPILSEIDHAAQGLS
ncbi:MFS transporter [Paraliobacillus ryukyuensis]|uniref:MFS transporter n=1 Tax=Paraliobacillus ryukyuensis TaxID=200904 RepID=UPI0009A5729A|nr:MFS transporter [Paraliobacillus ryukyuensis]